MKIKLYRIFYLCLVFYLLTCSSTNEKNLNSEAIIKPKGIIVNRGLYLVGEEVITDEDLNNMIQKLRRQGKRGRKNKLKTKALDLLVERIIVKLTAEEKAIIISNDRIENEIQRRRIFQSSSLRVFKKKIEKETGLPFEEWKRDLRYNLLKRQLLQFVLQVTPPTLKEIKRFYRKNRKRIGFEVSYREIVLLPQNSSFEEEARISSIANQIYRYLAQNPDSFSSVARKNSHNNSLYKSRGGLVSSRSIFDIAPKNPILATFLFRSPKKKVVRPFRDSLNRYVILKVVRRRPLPLHKVQNLILGQLYSEKEGKVFQKWIEKKKKSITIISI